ncbi:MAG: methyltransferase domain-containing protein [Saprospiraceae bacterium]|nr:methyltransferase domain-containing protein [Saprospiraceae bacterium]
MKKYFSYQEILEVARQLEKDIRQLDILQLDVHEAVKSYLRFDLKKLQYVSECNAFMLYHILYGRQNLQPQTLIVDHGAGIGLFAMLVKRLGLSCLCHDISPEYIDGIKHLGFVLNAMPDEFVTGDTNELVEFCKERKLQIAALASRNVIEHIPDYSTFFKELHQIATPGFIILITTSANIHNPIVRYIHKKIHKQYENFGSNSDMDNPTLNNRNCGMALRKEIIQEVFPDLHDDVLNLLAKNNRGFTKDIIIQRVQSFIKSGVLPSPIDHPTNTCDPITGVWVERLVPVSDYQKAAMDADFQFETLKGFYNTHYSKSIYNSAAKWMNKILNVLPDDHVALSPFLAMKLSQNHESL